MSYYHSSGYICGLYYNSPVNPYRPKVYLPQVQLQAHATILSTTSRTVLKQTFVNPSTEKAIREVRYTFPLYDGVSVVGFTCHVGDRTIVGEVKEKEKARAVFKDAVAKGQTAGLFEQLPEVSDVFTTTVGNIPPGAKVIVEITYLGELKHDMEVDGIRFTIPNIICPRYGSYPTGLHSNATAQEAIGNGISITVDADMADGSFIQKIQSPSHPISMTMGTTSLAPDADPTMTKASASLTLGTAELDKDFIVQIIAKNTGIPKAVLETHPSLPNHKALMATLVPKFSLPPEKPELVFVCDRSGSMDGSNMRLVKQALKVFLKSLPVGVKFNICSFGSSYSFLWPKSVTYSQTTLDEAIRHAETFNANFGGTEMLQPIKATIKQRYNDMPLDLMLLTDGEIWNQKELFSYLNESVQESKAPIRVFTLGIGNGASHALIEGVARAGNGFSQTVADGEKMDTKVVRMLKGALSPHINDYTLEVKYADTNVDGEDDDFELVEKVRDSLKVNLTISDAAAKPSTKKPISLFDTSADPDQEDAAVPDETGEARYAHLPSIAVPKIVQAPQNIPSLFAFNRTTVYLLLGPEAPRAKPTSVTLRGTSAHGPLELEIPVQSLEQPGETIHQMAAKKAISELEQGRGWLSQAKDETNTLLKTKFEGRFDDMVEREAVRLGVQFQVGGKWCSFVAVESSKKDKKKEKEMEDWEFIEDETKPQSSPPGFSGNKPEPIDTSLQSAPPPGAAALSGKRIQSFFGTPSTQSVPSKRSGSALMSAPNSSHDPNNTPLQDYQMQMMLLEQQNKKRLLMARQEQDDTQGSSAPPPGGGSFGSASPGAAAPGAPIFAFQRSQIQAQQMQQQAQMQHSPAPASSGALFGSAMPMQQSATSPPPPQPQSFGHGAPSGYSMHYSMASTGQASSPSTPSASSGRPQPRKKKHAPAPPPPQPPTGMPPFGNINGNGDPSFDLDLGLGFGDDTALENFDFDSFLQNPGGDDFDPMSGGFDFNPDPGLVGRVPEDLTHYLISLQTFQGFWELTAILMRELAIEDWANKAVEYKLDPTTFATALVVAVFEIRLKKFEGSWELVVEKAKGWLKEQGVDVASVVEKMGELVKQMPQVLGLHPDDL